MDRAWERGRDYPQAGMFSCHMGPVSRAELGVLTNPFPHSGAAESHGGNCAVPLNTGLCDRKFLAKTLCSLLFRIPPAHVGTREAGRPGWGQGLGPEAWARSPSVGQLWHEVGIILSPLWCSGRSPKSCCGWVKGGRRLADLP